MCLLKVRILFYTLIFFFLSLNKSLFEVKETGTAVNITKASERKRVKNKDTKPVRVRYTNL